MDPEPAREPRVEAEMLAEYLRGRDVLCPACSYNLRGVGDGICPECGMAVTMRVAEVAPHSAYWYAALSALVWPLLFNGILSGMWLFLAIDTVRRRDSLRTVFSNQRLPAELTSVTITLACLGLLVFLVRTRHRPWRPRTRRNILVFMVVLFALHAFWLVPVFVGKLL